MTNQKRDREMRKRNVLRSEYWERWVEKMRGRKKIGIEQI